MIQKMRKSKIKNPAYNSGSEASLAKVRKINKDEEKFIVTCLVKDSRALFPIALTALDEKHAKKKALGYKGVVKVISVDRKESKKNPNLSYIGSSFGSIKIFGRSC